MVIMGGAYVGNDVEASPAKTVSDAVIIDIDGKKIFFIT